MVGCPWVVVSFAFITNPTNKCRVSHLFGSLAVIAFVMRSMPCGCSCRVPLRGTLFAPCAVRCQDATPKARPWWLAHLAFGGNRRMVVVSPLPTNLNEAVTRLRDEVTSVFSVDVLPCFCTRDGLRTIAQLRSRFNELMTAGWLVVMYICLPSATYADATAFIR